MINFNNNPLRGASERLFWGFSFKYRKKLLPLLLVVILAGSIYLIFEIVAMQNKIKNLSLYEPVYVLALKRDIAIGDRLTLEDLEPVLYLKSEFNKLFYIEESSGLKKPSLFQVTQSMSQIPILGRVVAKPLLRGSVIRAEDLAEPGAIPGLVSLLSKNHSLIDLEVPQQGFNIFIKPGDKVDLYYSSEHNTQPVFVGARVILVDSLPAGKSPFQVKPDPHAKRSISIEIPNNIFEKILGLKTAQSLLVTYRNHQAADEEPLAPKPLLVRIPERIFQDLVLMKGETKEKHYS